MVWSDTYEKSRPDEGDLTSAKREVPPSFVEQCDHVCDECWDQLHDLAEEYFARPGSVNTATIAETIVDFAKDEGVEEVKTLYFENEDIDQMSKSQIRSSKEYIGCKILRNGHGN